MKIKITRKAVADILEAIAATREMMEMRPGPGGKQVASTKAWPVFFEHFMKRNQDRLNTEFRALGKKEYETLKPYYDARAAMNKELAVKDEKGQPVIEKGQYKMPEGLDYQAKAKELEAKYEKEFATWEEFLSEQVEIEPYVLDLARIENLTLPPGVLEIIMPLLKE